MNVNFEYFIDESEEDLTFVIENNNRKRKGFVDLCFNIDSKVYGDDE